jgi:hypothetical protein
MIAEGYRLDESILGYVYSMIFFYDSIYKLFVPPPGYPLVQFPTDQSPSTTE